METDWAWLLLVTDPLGFCEDPTSVPARLPEPCRRFEGGLLALSAGNAALARCFFDREGEAAVASGDGAAANLAVGLSWLAELRCFNLFPTGAGAGSIEIQMRWNGSERAKAMIERGARARALPGAGESRDARTWLEFVSGRMPALATARDSAGSPFAETLIQMQVQQCDFARSDAAAIDPSAVAFVERSMAEILAAGGRFAEARERLSRAHDAYLRAGNDLGVAGCHALRGDWLLAPRSSAILQNLIIAESVSETSDLSWPEEAVEGGTDGDIDGARAAFDEAARLCETRGARALGAVLLRMAHVAAISGRHTERLDLIERAIGLFQASSDRSFEHLGRATRALALLDARRFPEDRETAVAIGTWGRGEGSFSDALGLGLLFTRAGRQALLRVGDYQRAEACYQLAHSLCDALGARQRAAQTHADLAALHQAVGNRDRARTHLEEAIDAMRSDDIARGASLAIVPLRAGLLSHRLYAEALEHRDFAGMERAVGRMKQLAADVGDALFTSPVGGLLAETLVQAGVMIPLYRAMTARKDGQDREAERLFDEAQAQAAAIDSSQGRMLVAVTLATRQLFIDAVKAFDVYLATKSGQLDLSSALLMAMHAANPERADIEVQNQKRRSAGLSFGFMVRARAFERAEASLQELVSLAGPSWWRDERPWRNLSDAGEMYEGLGKYELALRHYELAIDELEQRRSLLSGDELKTALAADQGVQHMYFQAVRAALRCAEEAPDEPAKRALTARAFVLSEMGRARALLDLLQAGTLGAASPTDLPPDILLWRQLTVQSQVWRGLLSQARSADTPDAAQKIQHLTTQVNNCEQSLYTLGRTLADRYPGIPEMSPVAARVSTLEDITALLPPATAILQYMTLGDHLLSWAITNKGMQAAPIADVRVEKLAGAARAFHATCSRGRALDQQETEEAATLLTSLLLAPFAAVLNGHERLIVIPYGNLHLVPFAALKWKTEQVADNNVDNGAWLGERWSISYLPSASALPLLHARCASSGAVTVLAVGDPSHMSHEPPFGARTDLPFLEHAGAEARRVAELFGTMPLVGPDATKTKVLGQIHEHRILHFATHGLLYPEAPFLSGIALAEGEVLTVQELMTMNLDANLVTLSACKTALGVRTEGDEVLGLTRGLLAAGARSAVVSLWSVLDGSTAVLMGQFYEGLHADPPLDPPSALKLAQDWMRKLKPEEFAAKIAVLRGLREADEDPDSALGPIHPRHWAAFVVVGA